MERATYAAALSEGYQARRVAGAFTAPPPPPPRKFVAWSNHNIPEANTLRLEEEAEVKRGKPPTPRLAADWRARFEDVIWAMLNAPEWARVR
jgi:hypothetical protein